jgi:hypothetical protein
MPALTAPARPGPWLLVPLVLLAHLGLLALAASPQPSDPPAAAPAAPAAGAGDTGPPAPRPVAAGPVAWTLQAAPTPAGAAPAAEAAPAGAMTEVRARVAAVSAGGTAGVTAGVAAGAAIPAASPVEQATMTDAPVKRPAPRAPQVVSTGSGTDSPAPQALQASAPEPRAGLALVAAGPEDGQAGAYTAARAARAAAAAEADGSARPVLAAAALQAAAPATPTADPRPRADAEPDAAPLPTYTTEVPPSMTLHYAMSRGMLSGRGTLQWRRAGGTYELALEVTVMGVAALSQSSRGGFDAAGLAPQRFVDRRRGRDAQAANFRRDAGLVSFSGSAGSLPLPPGAQDRLSWLVQLPAVLAANPALRRPGSELRAFVVGARGDGAAWSFSVLGAPTVTLADGRPVAALHLQRLPRHEHDTLAEVWLDATRHYMPVRVVLRSGDGEPLELRLERVEPP